MTDNPDAGGDTGNTDAGGSPATALDAASPTAPSNPSEYLAQPLTNFLDDNYKESSNFTKYKTLGDLFKGYESATSKLGVNPENLIKKLGENPTDDERNAYLDQFRPTTPDEYGAPKVEGFDFKDDGIKKMQKLAHDNGLSSGQYSAVMEMLAQNQVEIATANQEAYEALVEESAAKLKQSWGSAFDERKTMAEQALNAAGEDVINILKGSGVLGHASVFEWLAKLGPGLREHGAKDGDGASTPGGTAGAMTPSEAKAEIATLRGDKEFMKKYLSGDKPSVVRMTKLYEYSTGGQ